MDQVVLRGEQLLDLAKPRVLVLGIIPETVQRNEYWVNTSLMKPYFEISDVNLELRNVPVPEYSEPEDPTDAVNLNRIRRVFGYSYAIDWVADRLGLRDSWRKQSYLTMQAHLRAADVACLLWGRLAGAVGDRDIHLFALAQYAGGHITGEYNRRDTYEIERVLDCARDAGFVVVDSFDALKRHHDAKDGSFWPMWVKQPYDDHRHTGHMSVNGNRFTAELLAGAIEREVPELGRD